MNSFRPRWFSFVLLLLIVSTASAIGQTRRVLKTPHQAIPAGKQCSDCHKARYAEWKTGPHGANQVDCTVCHGTVPASFTTDPKLSICEGCHTENVAQLKSDPFMQGKNCFACHSPHALKPHHKVAPASKG